MIKIKYKGVRSKITAFVVIVCLLIQTEASAIAILRDAESEAYIREILDEILIAADIRPKSVNTFLVQDDSINAFVFGGPNVFVNTGLIQSFESYTALQAVLAHEVGHLKGSHNISFYSKADKVLLEALFYSVSGLLIAAGGGVGGVLVGLSAGLNVANKSLLNYSRLQENEADFYAFQFLSKINAPKEGVLDVFERFKEMQQRAFTFADTKTYQYDTTHPFAVDRLEFFKQKFENITYKPKISEELEKKHLRVSAKLGGYLNNLKLGYSKKFLSSPLDALYYLGYAYVVRGNFDKARESFERMLEIETQNPYIFEAIAEVEYKSQNYVKSVALIKKALEIRPKEFLFLMQLAESYIALKEYDLAIKQLEFASVQEPFNPQVSFKLANVYSLKGDEAVAQLYFIESEMARQNYPKATMLFNAFKQRNYKIDPKFAQKVTDFNFYLSSK